MNQIWALNNPQRVQKPLDKLIKTNLTLGDAEDEF